MLIVTVKPAVEEEQEEKGKQPSFTLNCKLKLLNVDFRPVAWGGSIVLTNPPPPLPTLPLLIANSCKKSWIMQ